MLKMTTCGWRIREGHTRGHDSEKDRVNITWMNSLCEGVGVNVDLKKWMRGRKRMKGGLHNWPGIGRVQDVLSGTETSRLGRRPRRCKYKAA